MSRKRGWCFTVFDKTDEDFTKVCSLKSEYLIVGLELCPTTLKPHCQCYAYMHEAKTLQQMRKLLPKDTRLFEAKGNMQQNKDYCSKDGNWFLEIGTIKTKGERNDIKSIYACAKEAGCVMDVIEQIPTASRYIKAIEYIQRNMPITYKCNVFIYDIEDPIRIFIKNNFKNPLFLYNMDELPLYVEGNYDIVVMQEPFHYSRVLDCFTNNDPYIIKNGYQIHRILPKNFLFIYNKLDDITLDYPSVKLISSMITDKKDGLQEEF